MNNTIVYKTKKRIRADRGYDALSLSPRRRIYEKDVERVLKIHVLTYTFLLETHPATLCESLSFLFIKERLLLAVQGARNESSCVCSASFCLPIFRPPLPTRSFDI